MNYIETHNITRKPIFLEYWIAPYSTLIL